MRPHLTVALPKGAKKAQIQRQWGTDTPNRFFIIINTNNRLFFSVFYSFTFLFFCFNECHNKSLLACVCVYVLCLSATNPLLMDSVCDTDTDRNILYCSHLSLVLMLFPTGLFWVGIFDLIEIHFIII